MFKNYKSNSAFFLFLVTYLYVTFTTTTNKDGVDIPLYPDSVMWNSGILALIMSLFILFRSQITTDLLGKLIDAIGRK